MQALRHKRDFYAGGLMMLFGLFMAVNGPSYRLGTLMHMGPGFMPTVLGVILTFLGVLIAATAIGSPDVTAKNAFYPSIRNGGHVRVAHCSPNICSIAPKSATACSRMI
jgi:hypothetical protein